MAQKNKFYKSVYIFVCILLANFFFTVLNLRPNKVHASGSSTNPKQKEIKKGIFMPKKYITHLTFKILHNDSYLSQPNLKSC